VTDPKHPFIEQIDHIGILADRPKELFNFFTEVLNLPVAFPYTEYPFYTSGSVVLGNIFLEIMRFGSPRAATEMPTARYHILGFLNKPGTLAGSPAVLDRQRVPHSGLIPFFAPEATDENPVAIWSNIYLGGLLGENGWMRLLFSMTRQAKPKPSMMRSRLMNRMSLALMARAFRDGMPVLTEYYQQSGDEKRAADWAALRQRNGGAVGVECAQEVVVGVPAESNRREVWARLMAPLRLEDGTRYRLGPGPAVRLEAQGNAGIQTLVLRVSSLSRAEAFAHQAGVPAKMEGKSLRLELPQTGGLTMHLTEQALPAPNA
jgi:catechol 2,3-dioxygenase-like lactoylglutathione lyase family enzyme